jgi:hypothetical protein
MNLVGPPETKGLVVDLDSAELRPTPTSKRPNRRQSFYNTKCPACGKWAYRRKNAAFNAQKCRRCHCQTIAPKGYQATKNAHGSDFAIQIVRNYRLDNPSAAEQQIAIWMDGWDVPYLREELWAATHDGERYNFLLDFVIYDDTYPVEEHPEHWILIEMQGPFHKPGHRLAQEKTLARDRLLRSLWQGAILEIDTELLDRDPAAVKAQLMDFLDQCIQKERLK